LQLHAAYLGHWLFRETLAVSVPLIQIMFMRLV
jgi:hypothetical protein